MFQKKAALAFFFGSLFFLIGLLLFEYRSWLDHNRQLQELKEEYRMHVYEIKRVLADYLHTKERLGQIEAVLASDDYLMPRAQDFVEYTQKDTFVSVNRDLDYLKQQSQEYIKQQDLESLFRHMPDDVWLDYTDVALIEKKPKVAKKKRPAPQKTTTRSIASSAKKAERANLFSWPIRRSRFWLSSLYGRRKNANGTWGFHRAIDMAAIKGTPVMAAASGVVIEARNTQRGYGKTIVIKHNNKYKTRYAHLNAIHVKVGQKVRRGMHIGDVGDTGSVRKSGKDASHLHFELCVFGERVNPLYYLA